VRSCRRANRITAPRLHRAAAICARMREELGRPDAVEGRLEPACGTAMTQGLFNGKRHTLGGPRLDRLSIQLVKYPSLDLQTQDQAYFN